MTHLNLDKASGSWSPGQVTDTTQLTSPFQTIPLSTPVSQFSLSSNTDFLTVLPSANGFQLSLNLQNRINSDSIIDDSLTSSDLANSSVGSSEIIDQTITNSDIADNTISAGQLTSNLAFTSGDLIDLSAVGHTTTGPQGLIIPNVTSANPASPSSGEGYLAYDTGETRCCFLMVQPGFKLAVT